MKILACSLLALMAAMPALASSVSVSAFDDISRAGGNSSGSDGNTPTAAATFTAGSVQTLTINSTSGGWNCTPGPLLGADGGNCFTTGFHVNAAGLISSIGGTDFNTALFGVFLDAGLPGSAPAGLQFYVSNNGLGGIQTNFASLSPVLGQIFFLGDGLTGTGSGSTQVFNIPTGATRLFLGFADAPSFNGNPGAFVDNNGSITVDFSLNAGAPEPGTYAMLLSGLAAVILARKRR